MLKIRKLIHFRKSTLKSVLCSLLTICLLVNYSSVSIFATGTSAEHIETIYMDGIEYTLEIDTEGNSIISAVFDGVLTTLELNNETGEGVVSNSNPTERDEIIVQVNELNENEVSIEIVNEEANQITSINSIEDLLDESYIGQALTLGGWALEQRSQHYLLH